MKRTNIVLDDKLVEDCLRSTEIKTRKALIDHALRLKCSQRTFYECINNTFYIDFIAS